MKNHSAKIIRQKLSRSRSIVPEVRCESVNINCISHCHFLFTNPANQADGELPSKWITTWKVAARQYDETNVRLTGELVVTLQKTNRVIQVSGGEEWAIWPKKYNL